MSREGAAIDPRRDTCLQMPVMDERHVVGSSSAVYREITALAAASSNKRSQHNTSQHHKHNLCHVGSAMCQHMTTAVSGTVPVQHMAAAAVHVNQTLPSRPGGGGFTRT